MKTQNLSKPSQVALAGMYLQLWIFYLEVAMEKPLACLGKESVSHQSMSGSACSKIAPPEGKISIIDKDKRLPRERMAVPFPLHFKLKA